MDPTDQLACLEYLWRAAAIKRDSQALSADEFEGCLEALRLLASSFGLERVLMQKIAVPPVGGDRFGNARPRRSR